jgi:RNA polymerase sigma-70 factor (ECF subfamily)
MAQEPKPDQRQVVERLYRDHYDVVLRYLLRRVDPSTAEDITAETFLVAWRRLDSLPAREAGWLCGIARRVLANQRRADGRHQALVERSVTGPPPVPPGPEDIVLADLELSAALRALSETDREALLLAAWDRFEPAEAAAVLGCSRTAYTVRLHRARRRLATMLASRSTGDDAKGPTPVTRIMGGVQ